MNVKYLLNLLSSSNVYDKLQQGKISFFNFLWDDPSSTFTYITYLQQRETARCFSFTPVQSMFDSELWIPDLGQPRQRLRVVLFTK